MFSIRKLSLLATLTCAILSFPTWSALPQDMEQLCRSNAQKYKLYRSWRETLKPTKVVTVYAEIFMPKEFDREVQAVWRRVVSGEEADQAIDTHMTRYHSKRSKEDQQELRQRIVKELDDLRTYYKLAQVVETFEVTPEFVVELMQSKLNEGDNERYTQEVIRRAQKYVSEGYAVDDAAIRAGLDVRDMRDRDRGSAIARRDGEQDTLCYLNDLWLYELWVRRSVGKRLPEANSKAGQYFLGYEFPRHRFSAWQTAANP